MQRNITPAMIVYTLISSKPKIDGSLSVSELLCFSDEALFESPASPSPIFMLVVVGIDVICGGISRFVPGVGFAVIANVVEIFIAISVTVGD